MSKHDFDIGVIGGGAAGLTVASGAAQLGAACVLIEKEPTLGGDCLHYGCVPSKTLIRTATVYHQAKNLERYGLPRADIPPVDFRQVAARIQSVIDVIQEHDSVKRFCGLGVQVEFGQPVFMDEHAVDLDGKTFSAKKWVLATGSEPAAPPIPGLEATPYLTNKDIFSLNALPESMIVLGAGPIAIEMAQAFSRLGTQVQVVQRSGQILSKEDKDMADTAMQLMQAEGVIFHLNATTRGVRAEGQERVVEIETPEGAKSLRAVALLVALGRKCELESLKLENAGVEYTAKGVVVDSRMRASQKHIFAAGDVTGANQFTHAAGYEGGIVVTNAIFKLPRKADYTWLPWCTYTEPELASVGLNESRAREQEVETRIITEDFAHNDRALAEGEPAGRLKLVLDRKDKPLGVQILGLHAGELLSEWVAALNGGVKLSSLAGAIHPYPTLAEINKRAAGTLIGEKIFSEKVKKTLGFFFNYKGRACYLTEGELQTDPADTE